MVAIDPSVNPLRRAFQSCSDAYPDLAVSLQEIGPAIQDWTAFDLFIRLGEPEELPAFAAPLGIEQLMVVVNSGNSVTTLRDKETEAIFSGLITRWSDIDGPLQPIQVWVFPDGEQVNRTFELAVMSGKATTGHALLAPNAAAMLEAISEDPNAIGFLPQAWLVDSVRAVEIDPVLLQKLRLPVLALAAREPSGAAGRLLYCLQQGEGASEVANLYER
jgi:ABC-type phosphate transport system substrate-binding protein